MTLLFCQDVDRRFDDLLSVETSFANVAERNYAVLERKNGVVFTQSYIFARKHCGTSLANDNTTARSALARVELDPEVLRI